MKSFDSVFLEVVGEFLGFNNKYRKLRFGKRERTRNEILNKGLQYIIFFVSNTTKKKTGGTHKLYLFTILIRNVS